MHTAAADLLPEIQAVDADGVHQGVVMQVVGGRVAEEVVALERGQLLHTRLVALASEGIDEKLAPALADRPLRGLIGDGDTQPCLPPGGDRDPHESGEKSKPSGG